MCNLRMAFVTGCLLLLAVPASAQQIDNALARQRARIDSLLPEWRAAARQLRVADSISRAQRRTHPPVVDSALIGPFVVIAPLDEAAEHFRNFREAFARRAAIFEGMPAASRVRVFVERDIPRSTTLRFLAEQSRGRFIRIYGSSAGARTQQTRAAVDDAIAEFLPLRVRVWLGGAELSRANESARIYRQLATSPSPLVHACHRGNTAACIDALDLGSAPRVAVGLGQAARASFLLHALKQGAPGSLGRLQHDSTASVSVVLERLTRQPLATLVADWQNAVRNSYVSHAGLPRASLAASFWAAIALLFALRSTRRRAE